MTPTPFDEEQELAELLSAWGRQHDCEEAGCTVNLEGEDIPPGEPTRRTRTGLKRAKALWRRHRKGELT